MRLEQELGRGLVPRRRNARLRREGLRSGGRGLGLLDAELLQHYLHRLAGALDFLRLFLCCVQQPAGNSFGIFCRSPHLFSRSRDLRHQLVELFGGVIHRIGNSAGDPFRHCRTHPQIAVRQIAEFIHQAQNRALILAVDLCRCFGAATHIVQIGFGQHQQG